MRHLQEKKKKEKEGKSEKNRKQLSTGAESNKRKFPCKFLHFSLILLFLFSSGIPGSVFFPGFTARSNTLTSLDLPNSDSFQFEESNWLEGRVCRCQFLMQWYWWFVDFCIWIRFQRVVNWAIQLHIWDNKQWRVRI